MLSFPPHKVSIPLQVSNTSPALKMPLNKRLVVDLLSVIIPFWKIIRCEISI